MSGQISKNRARFGASFVARFGKSEGREWAVREKLKYHPFLWGSPLFKKAPPRQFRPPKCKLMPSKIQIGEGRFLCISIQKLQIGGRQSLFGGCQFAFWRGPICILEAEIALGVLYRKGVIPQKGWYFGFPRAVGSVVAGFCVFGAPRFSIQRSQNP